MCIESNCSANFEFSIKEVKGHPDVRMTPMHGDIIGNSLTPIDFSYFPQTFTTAEAIYEIRTSEFDFEPQLITVKGSAVP